MEILKCYNDFKDVVLDLLEFQDTLSDLDIDDMVQDWYVCYKSSSSEYYKVPFTRETVIEFVKSVFRDLRNDFSKHPIRFKL